MIKNKHTTVLLPYKVIRNILIILLVSVTIVGLLFAWNYISKAFFDKNDQDRFMILDTRSRILFEQLVKTSNESDIWKYSNVCSANKTGWMPTGDYSCLTSVSMKKNISSVQEINELQAKYFPIIDRDTDLTNKTELDPQLPEDFGINFVVSSAEKHYIEKKTGILCQYLIELNQLNETVDNFTYGSIIDGKTGVVLISLRCEDTARDHWYSLVKDTSTLIPEQTNN